MSCSGAFVIVDSGLWWKLCLEIFNWKIIKRTRNIDKIIVNHVDVSSCGMSSRRMLCSQSLT